MFSLPVSNNVARACSVAFIVAMMLLPGYALRADNNQQAEAQQFDRKDALAISQAAIGKQLGNYAFYTSQGEPRQLNAYHGKPLVISMIYTSCYHICPTTTQHLADVVRKARSALGDDSFQVVTVGFDTANDTADAMRIFARQQDVAIAGWEFLAGDADAVNGLARDLGFQFYPSPSGFDHLIQSSIVDKDGTVVRQVYGIRFETPHLIEPLKSLVFDEDLQQSFFDQLSTRIKLFCTVYDPASDSYMFDYSIFVGLTIGLVLGAFFIYLVAREWRHSKSHALKIPPGAG
jgi:protein SCO1/2